MGGSVKQIGGFDSDVEYKVKLVASVKDIKSLNAPLR